MMSKFLAFSASLAAAAAASATTCAAGSNCYSGPANGAWLSSSHWSASAFPTFPQFAVLSTRAVEVRAQTNGVGKRVIVPASAKLVIKGDGSLRLGPSDCDATQHNGAAPTSTADRGCIDNVICTPSEYEFSPRTPTVDRVCHPITTCEGGEYETAAPTSTTDRTCVTHSAACAADQWESTLAGTHTDRTCSALLTCTDAQYESTPPTWKSDRICTALTTCDFANQYESTPKSTTSNRVCTALTTCSAAQYISTPKAQTSDRSCTAHPICTQSEWETTPGLLRQRRVCAPLTTCDYSAQFESDAPTDTSNRVCAALTTCSATEWISTPKTQTTDRGCTAHTTCTGTQHQTRDGSSALDRVCQDNTVCEGAEYESALPTCDYDNQFAKGLLLLLGVMLVFSGITYSTKEPATAAGIDNLDHCTDFGSDSEVETQELPNVRSMLSRHLQRELRCRGIDFRGEVQVLRQRLTSVRTAEAAAEGGDAFGGVDNAIGVSYDSDIKLYADMLANDKHVDVRAELRARGLASAIGTEAEMQDRLRDGVLSGIYQATAIAIEQARAVDFDPVRQREVITIPFGGHRNEQAIRRLFVLALVICAIATFCGQHMIGAILGLVLFYVDAPKPLQPAFARLTGCAGERYSFGGQAGGPVATGGVVPLLGGGDIRPWSNLLGVQGEWRDRAGLVHPRMQLQQEHESRCWQASRAVAALLVSATAALVVGVADVLFDCGAVIALALGALVAYVVVEQLGDGDTKVLFLLAFKCLYGTEELCLAVAGSSGCDEAVSRLMQPRQECDGTAELADTGGTQARPISVFLCKAFVVTRIYGAVYLHQQNAVWLFAAVKMVAVAVLSGTALPLFAAVVLLWFFYCGRLQELEELVGIAKGSELGKALFGPRVHSCGYSGFNEWFKPYLLKFAVLTFETREEDAVPIHGGVGTTDEAWSFVERFLSSIWKAALDPGVADIHVGKLRSAIEDARRILLQTDTHSAAAAYLVYCGEHGNCVFDTMPPGTPGYA
jgi:hypothetical protein